MILDHLRLENFGAYGGIQEAVLSPADGKPVLLFGGMNGGGKTTLLDALLLVLYGAKAKVSNRGRMAYLNYLSDSIHRGADRGEGASIRLRFRRMVEGHTRYFELERSWRQGVKGIEESLRVERDGEPDEIFTEHWDEIVEAYLPVSISNLFFFDGEQIKELAEGANSAVILGSAIRSLLGLDLVDRLESDLKTLERRKKSEGLDEEAAKQLKKLQHEYQELEEQMEILALDKGTLTNQASKLAKERHAKEAIFKAEGGDLFLKRKEFERELAHLKAQKAEAENGLRQLAAGPLPLRLVEDALAEVEKQILLESEIRQNRALVSALEDRDKTVLNQLEGSNLDAKSISFIRKTLSKDRKERTLSAKQDLLLDADPHLAAQIQHLRSRVLPQATISMEEGVERLQRIEERIARIDAELSRVPEADTIAQFQRDLETARKAHANKIAEIDAQEIRIETFRRRRDDLIRQMERFGEEDQSAQIAEDDRQRILKHSARVRQTLNHFRTKVIQRHVNNMETLMLESFRELLRKQHLVQNLRIDPETFAVTLQDKRGQDLPFDRLSAGERQLLATAMLWGLARASGRPIPTVIDTPLGRLDSSHRNHLVERYFPRASHQVLLLSTDEEIVGNFHQKLEPFIARQYLLDHDEVLGSTNVKPGYFEIYETAR